MKTKPSAARKPAAKKAAVKKPADPGAAFCAAAARALERGEPDAVSDEALRRVLAAAVRLYAAKAEAVADEPPVFEADAVTATEAVVATCAMIRAVNLNLFDVAMWFRRPLAGAEGVRGE